MKRTNNHRYMLVLAFPLMMALVTNMSLAVSPVSAEKSRADWWGTQVPGSMTLHKIKIFGNCIRIHGKLRMDVIDGDWGGYVFHDGDICVAYEIIHYMEIEVSDEGVLSLVGSLLEQGLDPNDPELVAQFIQILYAYPRSGWFTWHTENGQVVARGTFRSDGEESYLWARGRVSVFVYGEFSVTWIQSPIPCPVIWHQGWYVDK